jgi:chaperone required for assembly of F1-ATPase
VLQRACPPPPPLLLQPCAACCCLSSKILKNALQTTCETPRARFYKAASATRLPSTERWAVMLDDRRCDAIRRKSQAALMTCCRSIVTPCGSTLLLPTAALAQAIAAEWHRQGDRVIPAFMPLMNLATTGSPLHL